MSGLFEWLYQLVHMATSALGYPGIFLLMLAENLFPPIPSEIVMPFAGFMAARGELLIAGVLFAGSLGSMAGALAIYFAGLRLGEERVRRWICRYGKFFLVADHDLDRALNTFERHGKMAIFFGRLIPGVRSLISVPAGMRQMEMKSFLGLTLAGTVLWNALLTGGGYILGQNWRAVLEFMDHYEKVILLAIGALLLVFAVRRLRHRPVNTGC